MKYLLSYKLFEGKDDKIGKELWFEYHCFESPESSDAEAWYRSHQKVKVLERGEDDHDEFPDEPKVYKVQFEDGLIYDVFDDELLESPDKFNRPDPPLRESKDDKPKETTPKELKKRWDKKRSAIFSLGNNIKKLRQKVSKDMDSEDEKTKMIATIVRIMDLTGERIGNETSKGEGHHGVSNFYKKHIKINGDTVSFSYTGKSGVKHKISVTDSKVARNLKQFMEIPGEVFVTTSGLSVKSPQVNKYLADFDITSKDLRGYRVNKLMSDRLRKLKKPETIGEIKKMFNEVLRDVAETIGHTPGICRKNYLLPEIEEQWYKGKEVQKV